MLEEQGGRCKSCLKQIGKKTAGIDHCHTTGKIRGILCMQCNTALGSLEDNPLKIEALLNYLLNS